MLDSHELLNTTLGNCRLTRILGQGGTSTVYLGRQQHPNRFVAVKVLYPRSTWESYEIFHARFWREVHIISRLSHRHIIPIYSYGTQPYPYLVMPYAREGSLEDMLARSGPPPFYRAIRYILAACSALDYAHQRDVIHRDLKPGNLLLLTPDTLVLADFGIASLQSSSLWGEQPTLTSSNIVLGTPAYMAPEMFMTRDIDHTVDIYALGILLYELLGGQIPRKQHPPFQAVNPQPLLSLSQQRPELPAAIDMIIWKATAYQPHRRYQSARHLAQDLQALFVAPDDQYTVYRSLYHYKPAHRKPVSSALQNTSRKPPDQKRRSAPRSTEPAPPMPPRRRKRRHTGFLLLWLLLLLGLCSGIAFLSLIAAVSAKTTSHPAHAVIATYFDSLQQHNYQAAYHCLSPVYQKDHPLDDFIRGFTSTRDQHYEINNTSYQSPRQVTIEITLTATEVLTNGRTYRAVYIWTGTLQCNARDQWEILAIQQHLIARAEIAA